MALTKPRAYQIFDLDYKQSTRVVTVTNLVLAGGAPNQVDGVNLSLNDRILVTGQTAGVQNGLYIVDTVGSGSNGTWVRTSDGNETGEIEAGMIVMVTEGATYADTQWKLITDNPIAINSTALIFTQNYSANSISSGTSNVTVNSNANVTISSAGTPNVLTVSSTGTVTSGTASVTGNVTGGNLLTNGLISATSNIIGGNLVTGGNVYTPRVFNGLSGLTVDAGYPGYIQFFNGTGPTVLIGDPGNISAIGNITGSNILTDGQVSATGNITANYFLGNVACASGIYASRIFNGTSEANIATAGGNANISIGGTSNVVVFASTGEYVTGLLSVTGNVAGGNLNTLGTISTTGNVQANNMLAFGNITSQGRVDSVFISASGNVDAGNVNATNISGTLTTVTQPNVTSLGNLTALNMSGNIMPTANNVYTLGSPTMVFQHLYVGPNSMYIGGAPLSTIDDGISLLFNGEPVVTANTDGTSTTYGNMVIVGNIAGSNILTGGQVSATGNLTGNYLLANIAFATGYTASKIYNGTSEANIGTSGGNANISIGGTSNVVVWATTGEYVTGLISATGNVTANNIVATTEITNGNITITGANIVSNGPTIYIDPNGTGSTDGNVIITGNLSVQGNVTYINSNNITTNDLTINMANNAATAADANGGGIGVGPAGSEYISLTYNSTSNIWVASNGLTSQGILSATGNVTGGNLLTNGLISATSAITSSGNVTGANLITSGSVLVTTNVSAAGNVRGGNINTNGLVTATGNIIGGNILTGGLISATGNVTGENILGNGAGLSGINVFSNITITGGNSALANSISDTLTLTAGDGISLVMDTSTDTLTIATSGGSDIFVDGADFGTVEETVTASDDLGLIIDAVEAESDLGTLVTSGLIYPDQLVLPNYTTSTLPSASIPGSFIFVSNATGGSIPAFADGTNWRRVDDRTIVT